MGLGLVPSFVVSLLAPLLMAVSGMQGAKDLLTSKARELRAQAQTMLAKFKGQSSQQPMPASLIVPKSPASTGKFQQRMATQRQQQQTQQTQPRHDLEQPQPHVLQQLLEGHQQQMSAAQLAADRAKELEESRAQQAATPKKQQQPQAGKQQRSKTMMSPGRKRPCAASPGGRTPVKRVSITTNVQPCKDDAVAVAHVTHQHVRDQHHCGAIDAHPCPLHEGQQQPQADKPAPIWPNASTAPAANTAAAGPWDAVADHMLVAGSAAAQGHIPGSSTTAMAAASDTMPLTAGPVNPTTATAAAQAAAPAGGATASASPEATAGVGFSGLTAVDAAALAARLSSWGAALLTTATQGIQVVGNMQQMKELTSVLQATGAFSFAVHLALDVPPPITMGVALPLPGRSNDQSSDAKRQQQPQQQEAEANWTWRLHGVAFSIRDGAACYVPLAAYTGGDVAVIWQALKAILEDKQSMKTTFALKGQLALLSEAPATLTLPPIAVTDPVVDVRIAAWMLQDSKCCEEHAASGRVSLVVRLHAVLADTSFVVCLYHSAHFCMVTACQYQTRVCNVSYHTPSE